MEVEGDIHLLSRAAAAAQWEVFSTRTAMSQRLEARARHLISRLEREALEALPRAPIPPTERPEVLVVTQPLTSRAARPSLQRPSFAVEDLAEVEEIQQALVEAEVQKLA